MKSQFSIGFHTLFPTLSVYIYIYIILYNMYVCIYIYGYICIEIKAISRYFPSILAVSRPGRRRLPALGPWRGCRHRSSAGNLHRPWVFFCFSADSALGLPSGNDDPVPYPMTDPCMVYMLTFGVYWWYMLPYLAYMDPMAIENGHRTWP